MFRLSLKNFKCFSDYSIDLNCDSLFLLDGPSGIGKSSLIQAFVFVITGDGKKLYKQGTKSLSVTVEYKKYKNNKEEGEEGYKIIRKKGPESLVFYNKGSIYEDDEAQTRIDKIFGSNFHMTSIIKQKGESSFLLASPKDKMIFLQNLLFSDTNIEDHKKKVKQKLKEYKDKCSVLEGQKQIFVNMLKTSKKLFDELIINRTENIETCNEQINLIRCKIEDTKKTKTNLLTKIKENTDINFTYTNNLSNLEKQFLLLISSDEKISRINKDIRDYDEKLQEIPPIEDLEQQLKDIRTELSLIKLQTKINDTKQILLDKILQEEEKIKIRIEKLNEEMKEKDNYDLSTYDRLIEKKELLKKYNDIKKNVENIDKNLQIEELENLKVNQELCKTFLNAAVLYKTSFKCPHCKTCVRLNNNILEKIEGDYETNDYSDEKVKQKKREFKEITEKIETIITTKKLLEHYENEKKKFEANLDKYNDLPCSSSIKEINQSVVLMDDLKEKQKEKEDLQRKQRQLEKEKNSISDNSHKSFVSEYKEFIELSKKIKTIRTEKKMEEEKSILLVQQKEYDTINDKLDDLKRERRKIQQEFQRNVSKEELQENIQDYKEKILELKQQIEKLENEYDIYKNMTFENEEKEIVNLIERIKYLEYQEEIIKLQREEEKIIEEYKVNEKNNVRCSIILSGIEYAESKMLSKFIDTINHNLSIHLDAFFTEPMTVFIKAFKENEKPLINLEIYYKGNETDLSNLSGGEYDRLNLALILTFNFLSQSKVLILDESLSSINQELSTDIIMHLKENKADKLVWMTQHQAVKGMFDNVFELKSL
jgi:DNA repair exonuclease SbcCD ATPase subunit